VDVDEKRIGQPTTLTRIFGAELLGATSVLLAVTGVLADSQKKNRMQWSTYHSRLLVCETWRASRLRRDG
jgi:hypothetical protein